MDPSKDSQGGDASQSSAPHNQHAAANLLRTQIDALFGDQPVASAPVSDPQPEPAQTQTVDQTTAPHQPAARSHGQMSHITPNSADQWQQYHTAWQDYYQQYYERFYAHHAAQHIQKVPADAETAKNQPNADDGYFTQPAPAEPSAESLSNQQAIQELRDKLVGTVKQRAVKIRKSRHFVPISAALIVVFIFVFLQFNRIFIGVVNAYVSPGAINPQNIIVNPADDQSVPAAPLLIIPKINVEVPIIFDTTPDHDAQMKAMEKGVAYFGVPGANSKPGQVGNTVMSGHSSNDLFDIGDYKFIFAQLDKLQAGDTIYVNYQSKRYTYVVTKTEVVKPTDVNKLIYPTTKPIVTLITCTPLGTALNRLLVTAEQVSPDPAAANTAPATTGSSNGSAIPGNSPTLFERLFGGQ